MNQAVEQLPDLYSDCLDPAIAEIIIARNSLVEQMAMLEFRISELTQCRAHKQAVSLSLSAEALARTAFQIRELSLSIHRGIAKRLNLEVRI